jgi:hypothetical protein
MLHMLTLASPVLSAGTAVSFGLDASSMPYMKENITWFVLETITWPILAFAVWRFINDSNYFKEEGVFTPQHILNEKQLSSLETTKASSTTMSKCDGPDDIVGQTVK